MATIEHPVASFPKEWKLKHGIEDFSKPKTQNVRGLGELTTQIFLMEDGSIYRVRNGLPTGSTQQLVPTAQVTSTPFMIRDDVGLHPRMQQEMMKLNYNTISISREQAWEKKLSQARTAYNMLVIANHVIGEQSNVDPQRVEFSGISRAGMLAIAAKAVSLCNKKTLGLDVYYFNAVAPCFYDPLKLSPGMLKAPSAELVSLGYHLAHLPLPIMLSCRNTLDLDPAYIKAGAKTLTTGTGRFVPFIPTSAKGSIRAYSDDALGMGDKWQRGFKGHEGVRVDIARPSLANVFRLGNSHMRALSYKDFKGDVELHKRLAEELKNTQGNVEAIDYGYVNTGE